MKELSNKTNEDLVKGLIEKREALRVFRFGTSGSKTRNTSEGKNLRRSIAQIMTEKRRRLII